MEEKIRVLFLITDLGKGGAERYLIDLCKELKANSLFDFRIAVLFDNNQFKEETIDFLIVNLDYKPFSFFRLSNKNLVLNELIQCFKPHIIHTHRFLAEFISAIHFNENTSYVCHGHDNMVQFENFCFNTLFSKYKLINYLEKRIILHKKYKKTSCWFLANSMHTKSYFLNVLPSSLKDYVLYKPLGFNYERFYNRCCRKIEGKKKFKILNIGSYQRKKNQAFIIEIARELLRKNIDFEINLIGVGETYEEVTEIIRTNELSDYVKQLGQIDDTVPYYLESDIYLHTAYYEPFGLVFLEAMASGLPIVCLDGKGNRDLIENGNNGIMIFKQNPMDFCEAIQSLIDNPIYYNTISENAKKHAVKYDFKLINNDILNFYKELYHSLNHEISLFKSESTNEV